MKVIYAAFFAFLFLLPSFSMAQPTTMRSMAASQLYVYGEAIYDRGDFPEAAKVFSRILWLEPTHAAALKIAKKLQKKGYEVYIPVLPAPSQPILKSEPVMVKVEASVDPNEDLKKNINQVDEDIEKIRKDVVDLHSQINQAPKEVQP